MGFKLSKQQPETANLAQSSASLTVIVIGAGIAGLTAAASLRKAGHSVQIYEKSKFAAETGAALLISPNGARVLEDLGFDFERAQSRVATMWETLHGSNMERFAAVDFSDAEQRFGQLVRTIHRVDLHNELLRLTLGEGENKGGLNLSSPVTRVDAESGTIELASGEVRKADIIVAADGLHSVARQAVIKDDPRTLSTGLSAFRFLLPTSVIQTDPVAATVLQRKARGATIIADTSDKVNERHMVWYDCRGGTVQNFVGIHPSRASTTESAKDAMSKEFEHFHPSIRQFINLADDIKCWPLYAYSPFSSLYKDRVVLIGDSAHPMLPFGGQGSNQAIEDAGALGQLFRNLQSGEDIPIRLQKFEKLRLNRVGMIQILSSVRVGRESEVASRLEKFTTTTVKAPASFAERIDHHFSYDVLSQSRVAML